MFNREIRVNWVKKTKEQPKSADETSQEIEGVVAHVAYTVERLAHKIGTAVICYVVVDTVRQVLVAKASKS